MEPPGLVPPRSVADGSWPAFVRRHLWALPLLLSVLFVAGAMVWLRASEAQDRDAQRQSLISDALSLQAQLEANLDAEQLQLQGLAEGLQGNGGRLSRADFANDSRVIDGLSRVWRSLVWLDPAGRIAAQAPASEVALSPMKRGRSELSAHLVVNLNDGGRLVARYDPGAILRREVPWWLARKYDVRMIDSFDTVIASSAERPRDPAQAWYRLSLEPRLPNTWLELTARDLIKPWWRSMPVWMTLGFLLMSGVATATLRRQVRSVERAEERWRNEAAWRRSMEDSLTVGLRARDLDGRLVYANRGFANMVGYEPEELVGLLPPMPYWAPDHLEATMWRHRRNMAGQAPREGYEARWRTRDGRVVDALVFEAPLVDAHGRHIGWMASIVNNTERKRLEENERRQTEALAHQARLTMLGEVASTLAHELNQPLTAITSYNAGVLNSLQRQGMSDPVLIGALQRLGEQASHAGRIVQRIREFLTRRQPRQERCDLHVLIGEAMALLNRELERQSVHVLLSLQAEPLCARADRVLAEQVLINLVRNACDAMSVVPAQARRIEIRAQMVGQNFVRIDVLDSGPGLQGRNIEALCAPFYSTKGDGMGMGLAICRSILEAHQGALDATDRPNGGGACFSFTLPAWLDDDAGAVTPAGDDEPADRPLSETLAPPGNQPHEQRTP